MVEESKKIEQKNHQLSKENTELGKSIDQLNTDQKINLNTIDIQAKRIEKRGEKITELKAENAKLAKCPEISQAEFAKYKSPEQVAEAEKLAQQTEAEKYQGFI